MQSFKPLKSEKYSYILRNIGSSIFNLVPEHKSNKVLGFVDNTIELQENIEGARTGMFILRKSCPSVAELTEIR